MEEFLWVGKKRQNEDREVNIQRNKYTRTKDEKGLDRLGRDTADAVTYITQNKLCLALESLSWRVIFMDEVQRTVMPASFQS